MEANEPQYDWRPSALEHIEKTLGSLGEDLQERIGDWNPLKSYWIGTLEHLRGVARGEVKAWEMREHERRNG